MPMECVIPSDTYPNLQIKTKQIIISYKDEFSQTMIFPSIQEIENAVVETGK